MTTRCGFVGQGISWVGETPFDETVDQGTEVSEASSTACIVLLDRDVEMPFEFEEKLEVSERVGASCCIGAWGRSSSDRRQIAAQRG